MYIFVVSFLSCRINEPIVLCEVLPSAIIFSWLIVLCSLLFKIICRKINKCFCLHCICYWMKERKWWTASPVYLEEQGKDHEVCCPAWTVQTYAPWKAENVTFGDNTESSVASYSLMAPLNISCLYLEVKSLLPWLSYASCNGILMWPDCLYFTCWPSIGPHDPASLPHSPSAGRGAEASAAIETGVRRAR